MAGRTRRSEGEQSFDDLFNQALSAEGLSLILKAASSWVYERYFGGDSKMHPAVLRSLRLHGATIPEAAIMDAIALLHNLAYDQSSKCDEILGARPRNGRSRSKMRKPAGDTPSCTPVRPVMLRDSDHAPNETMAEAV
jgi:hypothetical protein